MLVVLLMAAAGAPNGPASVWRVGVLAADTQVPVVAISSPPSGATVSGVFAVSGTASDNMALSVVEVRVDSGSYMTASGTTSWQRSIDSRTYANGAHTITVRATDSSGNQASAARTFTFSNGGDLIFPARAAFYYPWFPETWSVNGAHVFYHPTLGYYDSSGGAVIGAHVRALDYAKVRVAIASWWGTGTHSESTRLPMLLDSTAAQGSPLKWALYYEREGQANPTVTELQADLSYVKANYAGKPAYARVGGKPVIFVYNQNDTTCEVADRWKQASGGQWYVVLKVFSGYRTCANQPDSWHQYSPAVASDSQSGYSYAISPGFWRADEAAPRLARDLGRWRQNIRDMVASGAPWQLVTTFNEWGEGTAAEIAQEWTTPSGYGDYLDALHDAG